MVKDAESHASEDEERRSKVEARNQLDSLVYQVERDTEEWGDKVGGATKERIDTALGQAKEALKGDDLSALNAARDELMQAFSAAGQEMYQAQAAQEEGDATADGGAQPEGGAQSAEPDADEDVVEADYEIVDEEK